MDILKLIGRRGDLFGSDIDRLDRQLRELVSGARFLVIGGAGSIGQAVTREIFKRAPRILHVVDVSENNMVELVRDIRSSLGYIEGNFSTFSVDCGSPEFDALIHHEGPYDYVLNLSAHKHVRSEKDPYTLMRMVQVNIFNTEKTAMQAGAFGARKYFCVSTDKAVNPVNMMGASKRIMEMYLMRVSGSLPISMARFANVAFSDGSLLHGFNQRILKEQPLSAPNDVKRIFVTPQESGQLCLLSCLLGENRDIFFPKLSEKSHSLTFAEIAEKYLEQSGYEAYPCASEEEARARVVELKTQGKYPCYFFGSDTTGEKDFEEFFTSNELLEMRNFDNIGVIKNEARYDDTRLEGFSNAIAALRSNGKWGRADIIDLFNGMIPNFNHKETGKFLDNRM